MRRFLPGLLSLLILLSIRPAPAAEPPADFSLHDGDTVGFLGDSITAASGYAKIIEEYTVLHYPERNVRFFNAGVGGDTAERAVQRLDRDVFSQNPTVVTVAFGINDIAWGTRGDDEHKQRYLDGIRTIIEQCKAHHARPVICSAAVTDTTQPDEAENGYLQKMCDEGLALAKSLGAETIDVQRGMREVQRKIVAAEANEKESAKRTRMHLPDGVHLNDLGHLSMAYTILKGLGAPSLVSAVTLDARNFAAPIIAENCDVSEVQPRADGGVDFTRLDKGLPVNFGIFSVLNYRWVPVPDGINGYRLTVNNLPPGDYRLFVEGRDVGKFNAGQLAAGQNISSSTGDGFAPGGPWDAQALVLKRIVESRNEMNESRRERMHFLANHPQTAALDADTRALSDGIFALEHRTAKPYPYHFEVRKLASDHP